MKLFFSSLSLSLAILGALTGCGGVSEKKSDANPSISMGDDANGMPGTFPPTILTEFSTWATVINGDQAFISSGHGGITVRSYLNPAAVDHVKSQANPFPMAVGSILAKAVVSSSAVGVEASSRVYFMKKEAAGFDAENGDWSYSLANRVNGSLVYDSSVGPREQGCVSCHAKFAAYDFVQTVDFYKRQSTSGAGKFADSLLNDFKSWTPVLNGDKAFKSKGHGGITVRSYLNATATDHVNKIEAPYPMAVGSMLAKAVVSNAETGSDAASRVYYMRKEAAGFDASNGDWSYAVANRVNGNLVFDSKIGPRQDLCISCHAKFSAFDYVQTVDFYKRQTAGL